MYFWDILKDNKGINCYKYQPKEFLSRGMLLFMRDNSLFLLFHRIQIHSYLFFLHLHQMLIIFLIQKNFLLFFQPHLPPVLSLLSYIPFHLMHPVTHLLIFLLLLIFQSRLSLFLQCLQENLIGSLINLNI